MRSPYVHPQNDGSFPPQQGINNQQNVVARHGRSLLETRRRRLVFFGVVALVLIAILAIALGTSLGRKKKGVNNVHETSTTQSPSLSTNNTAATSFSETTANASTIMPTTDDSSDSSNHFSENDLNTEEYTTISAEPIIETTTTPIFDNETTVSISTTTSAWRTESDLTTISDLTTAKIDLTITSDSATTINDSATITSDSTATSDWTTGSYSTT